MSEEAETSKRLVRQMRRIVEDYHARVEVVATFLQDWDFREGAGEDRGFYVESAMDLLETLDSIGGISGANRAENVS